MHGVKYPLSLRFKRRQPRNPQNIITHYTAQIKRSALCM